MFLTLFYIFLMIEICFSTETDWVEVNQEVRNSRSMSVGNDARCKNSQQKLTSPEVQQNNQSLQRSQECDYYALIDTIKALSSECDSEEISEQSRKELKIEVIKLKYKKNKYEENRAKEFLRKHIQETSRHRLEAFCLMLATQEEALYLEYSLIMEQFSPYVQSILNTQYDARHKEVCTEEMQHSTRQRSQSEDFLISENKLLRAQMEQLLLEKEIQSRVFSPYVKQLLVDRHTKKTAELKEINIGVTKLQIIEIEDMLKNLQLDRNERRKLEIQLVNLNLDTAKLELAKIENIIESCEYFTEDTESMCIDADILRKKIRALEIEKKTKTEYMLPEQEILLSQESEFLKVEMQYLEKHKQYLKIRYKLQNANMTKGEQARLEMNFAFLQMELLAHCTKGDKAKEMFDILASYKRMYEEMERIEGLFRKDQETRTSLSSSANTSTRVDVSSDGFVLKNYIKHYLAKKYQELFNEIRRNTIGRFLDREKRLSELSLAARESIDIRQESFVMTPEQYYLFGIKELTSRESLEQFVTKEQISQKTIEDMKKEYWYIKERMPFIQLPDGRFDFVEDTTRTIYEYGLMESYLLTDDQRCLLGIKYLELCGLDSITVNFQEGGGPA